MNERVRFDGKRTSWLVRAATKDGRYVLCTCSLFGRVHYTIIDNTLGIRGPMNVIGGGLSIFTTSGPDEAIDKAIAMLESDDGWEVSWRNRVRLNMAGTS